MTFFSMPRCVANCISWRFFGFELFPHLADKLPVGGLGVNERQRLHHLLRPLRGRVSPDGEDHHLVGGDSESLADSSTLGSSLPSGDVRVGVASDGEDLDVVARDPVADVGSPSPSWRSRGPRGADELSR